METTIKKYYHCAICGRTSVSESKIIECEKSHIKPAADSALETFYSRGKNKYPDSLSVPMENGNTATYRFMYALPTKDGE